MLLSTSTLTISSPGKDLSVDNLCLVKLLLLSHCILKVIFTLVVKYVSQFSAVSTFMFLYRVVAFYIYLQWN